jgi:hypothetical protein
LNGELALVPLARHHEPKPMRATAFSHLMTRVGAPAEFIRRLPAPLQLATTNYLLAVHDDSSSATLRLRGDEVAAVVSGRYAPMDPVELIDCVRTSLVRFGLLEDVRVRGVASGMVDNLRLILPGEEVAVKVGDVSNVGIDISTSSFGRSAIHLAPIVWRLRCTNGLRSAERRGQLSFRHVGDADRLRAAVGEALPSALAHARGLMTQWQRAVDFMVNDVQQLVEGMRELTIPERKAFETELVREAEVPALPEHMPLYSLVNALTSTARSAIPARRLELEALAGDVLSGSIKGERAEVLGVPPPGPDMLALPDRGRSSSGRRSVLLRQSTTGGAAASAAAALAGSSTTLPLPSMPRRCRQTIGRAGAAATAPISPPLAREKFLDVQKMFTFEFGDRRGSSRREDLATRRGRGAARWSGGTTLGLHL